MTPSPSPGSPSSGSSSAGSASTGGRSQAPVLPAEGPGSPAGFGARIAALAVDCVASALVAALVLSFVGRDSGLPGAAGALPGSWSLLPLAVDYVIGVLLTGQTVGMYLTRIRLVALDRPPAPSRVRPLQIVVRTVLLFVLIPAVIVDRTGRGLHDRVSGTAVVRA